LLDKEFDWQLILVACEYATFAFVHATISNEWQFTGLRFGLGIGIIVSLCEI